MIKYFSPGVEKNLKGRKMDSVFRADAAIDGKSDPEIRENGLESKDGAEKKKQEQDGFVTPTALFCPSAD